MAERGSQSTSARCCPKTVKSDKPQRVERQAGRLALVSGLLLALAIPLAACGSSSNRIVCAIGSIGTRVQPVGKASRALHHSSASHGQAAVGPGDGRRCRQLAPQEPKCSHMRAAIEPGSCGDWHRLEGRSSAARSCKHWAHVGLLFGPGKQPGPRFNGARGAGVTPDHSVRSSDCRSVGASSRSTSQGLRPVANPPTRSVLVVTSLR
jgi:hypothetical protein